MAQQPLSTPFPTPPDFYQSFTAKNVAELRELEAQHAQQHSEQHDDSSNVPRLRADQVPDHLRNLRPPTPPEPGETFMVFGEERTLASRPPPVPVGERVLPAPSSPESRLPAPSPAGLQQLTRSILFNYLELLHVLVANPAGAEYGPKWEDLRDLFRSAHAMLNQYRAWQGREALIALMENAINEAGANEREWEQLEARARELLQHIGEEGARGGTADGARAADAKDEVKKREKSGDRDLSDAHTGTGTGTGTLGKRPSVRATPATRRGERKRMWDLLDASANADS